MAPMAELCITEARGEEETWKKNFKYKKNSNTKDAQEIHTHHAIQKEYTINTG